MRRRARGRLCVSVREGGIGRENASLLSDVDFVAAGVLLASARAPHPRGCTWPAAATAAPRSPLAPSRLRSAPAPGCARPARCRVRVPFAEVQLRMLHTQSKAVEARRRDAPLVHAALASFVEGARTAPAGRARRPARPGPAAAKRGLGQTAQATDPPSATSVAGSAS